MPNSTDLDVRTLKPMLLTEARSVPADPAFAVELKADGYRLLAQIEDRQVELRTRNGADATGWYPELARSLSGLTKARTVLDGEVVVLDELGRSDFNRLHARSRRRGWYSGADVVVYMAFDVLVLRGQDVRPLSFSRRRSLLERMLAKPRPHLLLSKHMSGELAPDLFQMVLRLKLEGIVLKRLDSPYSGGEPRTGDWVKIKRPGATPARRFNRDDVSL